MLQRRQLIASAGLCWAGGAAAGLPELIDLARPAVLPIGLLDPLGSPRFQFRGTAFVVGDGTQVLTNHHVLNLEGRRSNGRPPQWVLRRPSAGGGEEWRDLTVAAHDPAHDLAMLRLHGDPLPALKLADDAVLREGLAVLLIGYPVAGLLGFQPVSHRGMVSSIAPIALPAANASRLTDRAIAQLKRDSFDIVQLDATAYPGNSGGPVLDAASGEVVAVVNMVLAKGGREAALQHPSGISYAIPGRWARDLLLRAR